MTAVLTWLLVAALSAAVTTYAIAALAVFIRDLVRDTDNDWEQM